MRGKKVVPVLLLTCFLRRYIPFVTAIELRFFESEESEVLTASHASRDERLLQEEAEKSLTDTVYTNSDSCRLSTFRHVATC